MTTTTTAKQQIKSMYLWMAVVIVIAVPVLIFMNANYGLTGLIGGGILTIIGIAACYEIEGRGSDRPARLVTYAFLALIVFAFLFPIIWMTMTSLKTAAETAKPLQLLPQIAQWKNFPEAMAKLDFQNGLSNTIVVTVLCVIGQVLSCSLVGFGFAKFRFPGREGLFIVMLATMMLPGQVTMIPVFILFRSMGLVDNLAALIIPAWFGSAFFVYLFRQFFSSIPNEVLEAARVDGASNWRIFWQLMLPMSWPVIAVVTIYTFIGTWNDFMGPLIYMNSKEKATIALGLANFTGKYGSTDVHLLMAASLVTMIPCILVFFAAQKYFVESEFSAAVKG